MKNINLKFDVVEARQVSLKMDGSIEDYSKNFLNIFNNVRTHDDAFINVYNVSNGTVFVTCYPETEESVIEFLSGLGEIVSVDDVVALLPKDTMLDIQDKKLNGEDREIVLGKIQEW